MKFRLSRRQKCPIHQSYFCCGRESRLNNPPKFYQAVKVMADGRVICSPAELHRRKLRLMELDPRCGACGKLFEDFRDAALGHKISKGMNGGKHDDGWDNLVLLHHSANHEQGSMTLEAYLELRKSRGQSKCL